MCRRCVKFTLDKPTGTPSLGVQLGMTAPYTSAPVQQAKEQWSLIVPEEHQGFGSRAFEVEKFTLLLNLSNDYE